MMGKIICCAWVYPAGCDFIARGETLEEVMAQARDHARSHGVEPTPELEELVAGLVEDE
jgi:predicted small metal-binding protein